VKLIDDKDVPKKYTDQDDAKKFVPLSPSPLPECCDTLVQYKQILDAFDTHGETENSSPVRKKNPDQLVEKKEGKGTTDTLEMPPPFDHPGCRAVKPMVISWSKICHGPQG
jgi:hypothetical protein